ncbi:MAG TPA: hypothetical protein VGV90_13835 [Solirubrobacteraceae bacterium]|nr:hypothetical protein [Solirubrobacteraceae bacterium]
MKAVNLIPAEGSKGAAGAGANPRGAIGAYVVLAVLAIAVAIAGASAYTDRQLSSKQAQLARAESQAQRAEAKAASLKAYEDAATLRKARVETIGALLKGRFDWAQSLREVGRAVPSDVSLTSLVGTVAPDTAVDGGGGAGAGASLRAALPVPAIDLIGCAKSHADVAKLQASLRSIDGVQRVSLASSVKSDSASLNDTDCRATDTMPQFQMTVFYDAPEGLVPAVDATAPASGQAPPAAAAPAAKAGGAG